MIISSASLNYTHGFTALPAQAPGNSEERKAYEQKAIAVFGYISGFGRGTSMAYGSYYYPHPSLIYQLREEPRATTRNGIMETRLTTSPHMNGRA